MSTFLQQDLWQNDKFRRYTALGLLGVLLIVAVLFISSLYRSSFGEVDNLQNLLSRYEKIIQREPELRKKLDDMKQTNRTSRVLLTGANDALTGADLQERLKKLAASAGGILESTQMLSAEDEPPLQKITVRVQMSVNITALQRILYALETRRPYLFIENLDVKFLGNKSKNPNARQPNLKLIMDVAGYRDPRNNADDEGEGA